MKSKFLNLAFSALSELINYIPRPTSHSILLVAWLLTVCGRRPSNFFFSLVCMYLSSVGSPLLSFGKGIWTQAS